MIKLLNKAKVHTKDLIFVIRIKRMKKKADKLRDLTGSQHFIFLHKGKITCRSKRWFKLMHQHGVFPKNFTADNLKQISYYYTKP